MLSAQPDRPIAGPEEDRLGLQPFAEGLVNALLADDGRTARGVVLGLEGSWGSGKSSILNLVAARLAERAGERLVLVRFDPWLVSGRDDLIAAFFRELVDAIDPVRKERSRVGSAAAKLAEYGEMLSPALNLYLPFLGTARGRRHEGDGQGGRSLAQPDRDAQGRREGAGRAGPAGRRAGRRARPRRGHRGAHGGAARPRGPRFSQRLLCPGL